MASIQSDLMYKMQCCMFNILCVISRSLGGAEYTDALCNMEKQKPEPNGQAFFSDSRLVANGFKIKLTPGTL